MAIIDQEKEQANQARDVRPFHETAASRLAHTLDAFHAYFKKWSCTKLSQIYDFGFKVDETK
ncbi:hypothetical protein N7481_003536 [Penicillium waksmanii]|uniref:uncharacterized protein n=1 Tax=Penicillium waksmanii TaxID=69791 RepID=UPI0025492D3B|nr:uncharacterized protein N7481_003536 [Penicillium waksmanii]KAJ5988326.1 hypothetical protein N7481_003536 [Penicillium waksmanii]